MHALGGLTECVKGNFTFNFGGGQSKLYISFDGNDTGVDCSTYLSKVSDIQRGLQSVMNRPREGHLLAGCTSLYLHCGSRRHTSTGFAYAR